MSDAMAILEVKELICKNEPAIIREETHDEYKSSLRLMGSGFCIPAGESKPNAAKNSEALSVCFILRRR
jgi:hypothetical protein